MTVRTYDDPEHADRQMTQHTPGPWETNETSRSLKVKGRWSSRPCWTLWPQTWEPSGLHEGWIAAEIDNEANARVIAAAPDLLAACQDMIGYIEDYAASAEQDDPVHELLPRWRAAIAKAAGEQL